VKLSEDLTSALPEAVESMLFGIAREAKELDLNLFVVGGLVRDLALGSVDSSPDIDLMVDGDFGPLLTRIETGTVPAISSSHNVVSVTSFRDFLTTKVKFESNDCSISGFDLSQARDEVYPVGGGKPVVEKGSLEKDLARRDFSFNAMALPVYSQGFGELIDLFGGMRDLENGIVEILHEKSFRDDPVRLIRGARFIGRLGFSWGKLSQALSDQSAKSGLIYSVSRGRQAAEIRKALDDSKGFAGTAEELLRLGLMERAFPGLEGSQDLIADLALIEDTLLPELAEQSFELGELRFQRLWNLPEWPWEMSDELFWTPLYSRAARKRIVEARHFWLEKACFGEKS